MQETQETRFDLWVGKVPWSTAWQPTPGFLPGESQDRGARQAAVHWVVHSVDWVGTQTRCSVYWWWCERIIYGDSSRSQIAKSLRFLFSGRNRKRGERGRGRWGSKVALWYHINLKKGWCFKAEPVIHNGDPDSAMLGTWRFSVVAIFLKASFY